MIRFSWINLISVMIHLKYLYYNISSLELSCLPHHLCRISLWSTETPVNAILIMFFISFPILPYPIQLHTTITGYTKFIFTTLLVNTISPTISTKIFLHFNWFPPPPPPPFARSLFRLYMFIKSSLKSSLTLLSPILQQFFTSLILRTENPTIYIKSIFRISAI